MESQGGVEEVGKWRIGALFDPESGEEVVELDAGKLHLELKASDSRKILKLLENLWEGKHMPT